MKAIFAEFLKSKKAVAALVAVFMAVFGKKMGIDESALTEVVASICIYVAGQAVADHGKSAAQINADAATASADAAKAAADALAAALVAAKTNAAAPAAPEPKP